MTIDWQNFTPWTAMAGGVLIGLAAVWYILFNGRIAGISGVVGGLIGSVTGDRAWRLAFVLGLVAAPLVASYGFGYQFSPVSSGDLTLIIAGLLVGFGTRLGSGCTSGHGVCGLSRFSPRSLVATLCFMVAGFASVYVVRHLI